ncbi:hypothetical protein DFR58_103180 [Anaerobacterium chartisolvens]|uniref:Uncharacterized protein n=1 Tax=Anaerobacterium chartisolvens TaxID=1297424 RepID=A0A369BIB5_9FIRM|nr:hypothetical protein [Anaerobacterium chartisolvens]RCX19434.1 hypothetical protein DFR58_103180 [Anaerobacterium chartisolvens]
MLCLHKPDPFKIAIIAALLAIIGDTLALFLVVSAFKDKQEDIAEERKFLENQIQLYQEKLSKLK